MNKTLKCIFVIMLISAASAWAQTSQANQANQQVNICMLDQDNASIMRELLAPNPDKRQAVMHLLSISPLEVSLKCKLDLLAHYGLNLNLLTQEEIHQALGLQND